MIGMLLGLAMLSAGWQASYITDHPGRADWWVVATQDGLFSVVPLAEPRDEFSPACSAIHPGMNVWTLRRGYGDYPVENYAKYGADIFSVDGQYDCTLVIQRQESTQPCFQTAGVCDIDGEEL